MKIKTYISAIAVMGIILFAIDSHSISPAVKSTRDYGLTLSTLRRINIMIENFGDEQMKKKYFDVKALFQEAGENFYGQDFTASALKFRKVKTELIAMLEAIDDLYLKRTKEILDSSSKESFDSLIEYSKESGLGRYFIKPFDPLRDIKPYEPNKYHLFHDREKIEAYLREGYKRYYRAKSIFEDPEIALLKKKTTLTEKNMRYIIDSYMDVVSFCRQAKEEGIEIHRVTRINELGKSMLKYNISHGSITPIFDDRIPEKYKVDANDNIRLIHAVEMKKLQKNQAGFRQG
jgi:hypothetical protein